MPSSTVTSKGQITVPLEVRRALGLRRGSRVNFVRNAAGVYEVIPESSSVRSLKGMFAAPEIPVSLEEMDDAIAEGARQGAGS